MHRENFEYSSFQRGEGGATDALAPPRLLSQGLLSLLRRLKKSDGEVRAHHGNRSSRYPVPKLHSAWVPEVSASTRVWGWGSIMPRRGAQGTQPTPARAIFP